MVVVGMVDPKAVELEVMVVVVAVVDPNPQVVDVPLLNLLLLVQLGSRAGHHVYEARKTTSTQKSALHNVHFPSKRILRTQQSLFLNICS